MKVLRAYQLMAIICLSVVALQSPAKADTGPIDQIDYDFIVYSAGQFDYHMQSIAMYYAREHRAATNIYISAVSPSLVYVHVRYPNTGIRQVGKHSLYLGVNLDVLYSAPEVREYKIHFQHLLNNAISKLQSQYRSMGNMRIDGPL